MHNHLGKQLVIRDSKSADLTPMIKLLSGSPCVHAVRNYVMQQLRFVQSTTEYIPGCTK